MQGGAFDKNQTYILEEKRRSTKHVFSLIYINNIYFYLFIFVWKSRKSIHKNIHWHRYFDLANGLARTLGGHEDTLGDDPRMTHPRYKLRHYT